ncbi:hypothetical protein [Streptomyces colonosanans]|uniref:Uncharacterized protein n=1 Tax=Streptomyces colonosanans TaxID=1428652 RepID=A0A1S2PNL6_9ACTN|nr:hypothetical protein [Streptomyces colonosanans]OIJ95391.1 hypothetical protein BIV24_08905 [Streptomyces colonosanans]
MTSQLDPWDPNYRKPDVTQEPEGPCGRCAMCLEAQPMFDQVLDGADYSWACYQDPEQFSYTAIGSYLHRTTCAHVRRQMPTDHVRPHGEAYDRALQKWAHEHHDYNSPEAEERYSPHLRLYIVNPARARQWTAANIGPRGGRDYRLCKACRPSEP